MLDARITLSGSETSIWAKPSVLATVFNRSRIYSGLRLWNLTQNKLQQDVTTHHKIGYRFAHFQRSRCSGRWRCWTGDGSFWIMLQFWFGWLTYNQIRLSIVLYCLWITHSNTVHRSNINSFLDVPSLKYFIKELAAEI